MLDKLQALEEKYEERTREMSDPDIFNDPQAYNKLAKAHADLGEIVGKYRDYRQVLQDLEDAELMLDEPQDEDFAAMLNEEIERLSEAKEKLQGELQVFLLPRIPMMTKRNCGNQGGNRRRRSCPVCRHPVQDVFALCRGSALEGGYAQQQRHRTWRLQGSNLCD